MPVGNELSVPMIYNNTTKALLLYNSEGNVYWGGAVVGFSDSIVLKNARN